MIDLTHYCARDHAKICHRRGDLTVTGGVRGRNQRRACRRPDGGVEASVLIRRFFTIHDCGSVSCILTGARHGGGIVKLR